MYLGPILILKVWLINENVMCWKSPVSWQKSCLRKAFIWWSYRIIKHANMFEAFIRVATRWTPNAFHQWFMTAHMTISGQTTKQQAIQPKNIRQSVRRGMPSILPKQQKNERINRRNTRREIPKIQNYKKKYKRRREVQLAIKRGFTPPRFQGWNMLLCFYEPWRLFGLSFWFLRFLGFS